jgi:hypothetical protein
MSWVRAASAFAVSLLMASGAAAAPRPSENLPVQRVQDLHYGDVLFYFYQDENFEAITRLNAYEQWSRMPHHKAESELLLGGLYLSLGLHNEAGARFEKLLTADIPAGVRNRAWFYLAKVWYVRGYLEKAEDSIRMVQGQLSPALDAEKQHLFANILMRQGKFEEAVRLLKEWKGPVDWTAYARLNLGIALIRRNRVEEADPFLTSVGTLQSERSELLALKDRANLALGYSYLQINKPDKARPVLERVRLNGPFSNKALLGVGWADAELGNYRGALNLWLELQDRNLLDAAVQESYLAIPYAFGKLNANAQAAENYENAIRSFDTENGRIEQAIARIQQGNMLDQVLQGEKDSRYGWFWQLQTVPDAPESRYLYAVLAGHDFQEGLKNYRDLAYMGRTLDRWGDSMEAFSNMIDTRERAYAQRLPRADALLAAGTLDRLQQERNDAEARLGAIERNQDTAALGSQEEQDQWARIQQLEAALANAPADAETDALRDRLRLVKGVLYFRLNDSFKARLWQQRRSIKDLDLALRDAQNRWIRVQRARKSVPTNTGEFDARLAALKERIAAVQVRLASTRERQNAHLQRLAVAELRNQQERLATYQVQARFALASIYDRAANAADSEPVEPSPNSPPAPPSGEGAAPSTTSPPSTPAPPTNNAPPPEGAPPTGSAPPANGVPPSAAATERAP